MLEIQHSRIWSAMQSPSRTKYAFTTKVTVFWIPLAMSTDDLLLEDRLLDPPVTGDDTDR